MIKKIKENKRKKKNSGGRPTKFREEHLKLIKIMVQKGFTDKEIAEALNVTDRTINNWKKEKPKLFQSIKDWKIEADKKVERSLYERAHGYSHLEDKIFCNNGDITIQETVKHYPPDPVSMIFWLKNRQPKQWRDKHDIEHDVTPEATRFIVNLTKIKDK